MIYNANRSMPDMEGVWENVFTESEEPDAVWFAEVWLNIFDWPHRNQNNCVILAWQAALAYSFTLLWFLLCLEGTPSYTYEVLVDNVYEIKDTAEEIGHESGTPFQVKTDRKNTKTMSRRRNVLE